MFLYLRNYTTHKLQLRRKHCIFISYNVNYKGYHCLHPTTGHIYITHYAQVNELYSPDDGFSKPTGSLEFSSFTDPPPSRPEKQHSCAPMPPPTPMPIIGSCSFYLDTNGHEESSST